MASHKKFMRRLCFRPTNNKLAGVDYILVKMSAKDSSVKELKKANKSAGADAKKRAKVAKLRTKTARIRLQVNKYERKIVKLQHKIADMERKALVISGHARR